MNCNEPLSLNLIGSVLQGPPGDVANASLNPLSFGARDSATINSTEAVRKAHDLANRTGKAVSYAGISTILIDADAKIQINGSVDWGGCEIRSANGIVSSPSYTTHKTMYVVYDPACPLQKMTLNRSLCDLTPNARKPFGNQRDGFAGYYLVETNYKLLNRLRTGLTNYEQCLYLDSEGATALGLGADMTSATTVDVRYRASPRKFISLSNFVANPNDFNNQKLFDVQRSFVAINNHMLTSEAPNKLPDISALYQFNDVAGILIDGLTGPARNSPDIGGTALGTYVINPEGCAGLIMKRLNLTGNKSAIGSNNVNGLKLADSTVIRLDVHSSGFNIEADSVNFLDRGIGIGWGGGYIRANRCNLKTNLYPIISDREDYAGTWFSCVMEATHCTAETYAARRYAFITLSSFRVDGLFPGVGNLLTPTYMPDVITVSNCSRINNVLTGNITTQGVRIPVLAGAQVYAPRIININNINGVMAGSARFGNRIDLRSMLPHPTGGKTSISITNCEGTDAVPNETFQDEGLTLTTGSSNNLTATNAARFDLTVSGIDSVCIETGCTNGRIYINNSSVSRIALTSDDATRQALFITGGTAISAFIRAGETTAPIGYAASTPTVYFPTCVNGLHISGSNFNLLNASQLQGVHIRTGAAITLPTSATPATAFTGWKLNQFQ